MFQSIFLCWPNEQTQACIVTVKQERLSNLLGKVSAGNSAKHMAMCSKANESQDGALDLSKHLREDIF